MRKNRNDDANENGTAAVDFRACLMDETRPSLV